jgi:hypothetical protein
MPPTQSLVASAFSPTAQELAELGNHWGLGMEFRSLLCTGDPTAYDICAPAPMPEGTRSVLTDVDPFGVVVTDTCSTFGYKYNDYVGRVLRKHKAQESFVIATQFWGGGISPASFHLANGVNVTDVNPGSIMIPSEALALLEAELNECLHGARGMIYCSPRVFLNLWLLGGLYRPPGSRQIFSHMDTVIVADAGFPGTDPNGGIESPTVEWMYGTAPAKVYRSIPMVFPNDGDPTWQAVARDRNDVTFRAESLAAVVVDPCCLLGIKVAVGVGEAEGKGVGQTIVDHSGTIAVGNTAQTLMAANSARRYLLIENVSAGDLWFNFTTTAVVGQPSLRLPSGASFVMEDSPISTEAISIIGATGGQAFVSKEA